MRTRILDIEPVAIALLDIDMTGELRFSGIDLDSGELVTVAIERLGLGPQQSDNAAAQQDGLVLLLSLHTVDGLRPR